MLTSSWSRRHDWLNDETWKVSVRRTEKRWVTKNLVPHRTETGLAQWLSSDWQSTTTKPATVQLAMLQSTSNNRVRNMLTLFPNDRQILKERGVMSSRTTGSADGLTLCLNKIELGGKCRILRPRVVESATRWLCHCWMFWCDGDLRGEVPSTSCQSNRRQCDNSANWYFNINLT